MSSSTEPTISDVAHGLEDLKDQVNRRMAGLSKSLTDRMEESDRRTDVRFKSVEAKIEENTLNGLKPALKEIVEERRRAGALHTAYHTVWADIRRRFSWLKPGHGIVKYLITAAAASAISASIYHYVSSIPTGH